VNSHFDKYFKGKEAYMNRNLRVAGTLLGLIFIIFAATYYFFPGAMMKGLFRLKRAQSGLAKHEVSVGKDTWVFLRGGSGRPVVLLHGFGQHKDQWGNIPLALKDGHELIIPDLPGFGESSKNETEPYDIPSQAARLNGFIEACGLQRTDLAGISMGAGIAAYYAAQHPERIDRLVLISPFGILTPEKSYTQKMRDRHRDEDRTIVFRTADEFDFLMSLLVKRPPAIPDHLKSYMVGEQKALFSLHERIFRKDLLSRENILAEILPRIRARTLLIWGRDDLLVDVSGVSVFSAAIPGLTAVVLEDCGHVTYMDQPEKTESAIREFLIGE